MSDSTLGGGKVQRRFINQIFLHSVTCLEHAPRGDRRSRYSGNVSVAFRQTCELAGDRRTWSSCRLMGLNHIGIMISGDMVGSRACSNVVMFYVEEFIFQMLHKESILPLTSVNKSTMAWSSEYMSAGSILEVRCSIPLRKIENDISSIDTFITEIGSIVDSLVLNGIIKQIPVSISI